MNWNGIGLTDIGQYRENNEDRYFIDNKNNVYIVADGMGGVDGGEVAAQIIIDELPKLINLIISNFKDISCKKFQRSLSEKINGLNDLIYRQGIETGYYGMGSTLVGVMIQKDAAMIFHVGDSRCYRYGKEGLKLLTKDHSCPTDSYQLTRVLGTKETVHTDIKLVTLEKDDKLLLCSDGLNSMLSDNSISEIISKNDSNQSIGKNLIKEANDLGGEDNITTIVIESNT